MEHKGQLELREGSQRAVYLPSGLRPGPQAPPGGTIRVWGIRTPELFPEKSRLTGGFNIQVAGVTSNGMPREGRSPAGEGLSVLRSPERAKAEGPSGRSPVLSLQRMGRGSPERRTNMPSSYPPTRREGGQPLNAGHRASLPSPAWWRTTTSG